MKRNRFASGPGENQNFFKSWNFKDRTNITLISGPVRENGDKLKRLHRLSNDALNVNISILIVKLKDIFFGSLHLEISSNVSYTFKVPMGRQ